jgi:hypothetical protein
MLAACSPKAPAGVERIGRTPAWVLTVEDLRARVARVGHELGVATERVTVVGTLVAAPEPHPARAVRAPSARWWFADASRTRQRVAVEGLDGLELVVGRTYVVEGSVVPANDLPQRWKLVGVVSAVVEP